MENSLFERKCYGKIRICLKERMDALEMNRNTLSRLSQTRFEVVDKWYHGEVERIDSDVLARFCYILGCNPQDLIVYER